MPKKFDVIAIFPIYGQFGAISKPDSGRIVGKIYIVINSNFLFYKFESITKKSLAQLSHYCFEWRHYFGKKTFIFCKKCWHQQN